MDTLTAQHPTVLREADAPRVVVDWKRMGLWLTAAALTTVIFLPAVVRAYRTTDRRDFEQEWLSARNYLNGFPIYEKRTISLRRYAADGPALNGRSTGEGNAHLPSSILLGIPFARMSYPSAFLAWNLLSLLALVTSVVLVVRNLNIRWTSTKPLQNPSVWNPISRL